MTPAEQAATVRALLVTHNLSASVDILDALVARCEQAERERDAAYDSNAAFMSGAAYSQMHECWHNAEERAEAAEADATKEAERLSLMEVARDEAVERADRAEADAAQLRRLLTELRASLKNALEIANEIGAGEGSRPSSPVAPDGPDTEAIGG